MRKTLYIIAPIRSMSGYGQHSRLIVRSLLKYQDQYEIRIIVTQWGTTPQTAKVDDLEHLVHIGPVTSQPDVSVQVGIPNEFQRFGIKSIGVSAVTESSVCSLEFIEGANKMDLVIVPSEFTKKILTETTIEKKDHNTNQTIETIKCKVPVEVVFEGLDLSVFNKHKVRNSEYIDKQLASVKESFAFLCCSSWLQGVLGEDRKNVGALIQLFLNVFKNKGGNNRPALILKVHGAGFSEIEKDEIVTKIQMIKKSLNFKGVLPSIYLINGDLTDDEMNALYNHPKVKSMISLTHAEGFFLPLLEFTTTDKPIIVPNYSGYLDFLSKDRGTILLPGSMTKIHPSAANKWLIEGSEWFTPNYQFAGQIMNDMYENYEKYLIKSKGQAKHTRENFSLEKMGELLESHLITKQKSFHLPKLQKIV